MLPCYARRWAASACLAHLVERARPLFEQAGDDAALASLWMATWGLEHFRCRFGAAADAAMRAVEHATAAGERYLATWWRSNAAYGPMPVTDALSWLDQQAARVAGLLAGPASPAGRPVRGGPLGAPVRC
jgi:hypothetical protein